MWTLYITHILHKGDGIFILGLVLLEYGQLTKWYSVTVLINTPPPPKKISEIHIQLFPTVFPLQICHFLSYSQVPSGRVRQWGTKSAPGVFSQKKAPSSLQTRIPPGLQKKKKNGKRVSPSKLKCPFNPSL